MNRRDRSATRVVMLLILAQGLLACGESERRIERFGDFLKVADGQVAYAVDGDPFTGKVYVNWSPEQRKAEIELREGRPSGAVRVWHRNGKVAKEGALKWKEESKELMIVGESRNWDDSGALKLVERFNDNSEAHGAQEKWCDRSAHQESVENYDNGRQTGQSKVFDCTTGKLLREAQYVDGAMNGSLSAYSKTGERSLQANVENGQAVGEFKVWYTNGKPRLEATAKKVGGKSQSISEHQLADLDRRELLEMATFVGPYKELDEQGQIRIEGAFDEGGNKTGIWSSLRPGTGGYLREDYDTAGYGNLQYAGPFATALREGAGGAKQAMYYLEQKLVGANQKLQTTGGGDYETLDTSPRAQTVTRQWAYPMHYAAVELLDPLLEAGAQIDARDWAGRTRLHMCAERIDRRRCSSEELSLLIAKGADPKAVTIDGWNALMMLGVNDADRLRGRREALEEQTKAFDLLVKAGVPIDEADGKGQTLLMVALRAGRADIAKKLIEGGASVAAATRKGHLPIHWVFLRSEERIELTLTPFVEEMVPLLLAKGADINAPLDWGRDGKVTIKQLGLRSGAVELVQFLDRVAGST